MSSQLKRKVSMDVLMTVILLLQMSYSLIGEEQHKWLGILLGLSFIVHNILNRGFYRNLFRGTYTPYRVFQTVVAFLVVFLMAGSMVSGISLARNLFPFLPVRMGARTARLVHMLCAYWGFVMLSTHLGLHWAMMLGLMKRILPFQPAWKTAVLRLAGGLIAVYGIYAFAKRSIGSYMFLKSMFVFFDFGEPLPLFLMDYLAVMGLFVFAGYYVSELLKKWPELRRRRQKEKEVSEWVKTY